MLQQQASTGLCDLLTALPVAERKHRRQMPVTVCHKRWHRWLRPPPRQVNHADGSPWTHLTCSAGIALAACPTPKWQHWCFSRYTAAHRRISQTCTSQRLRPVTISARLAPSHESYRDPELVWATGRLMSPDRGFGTSCLFHCGRLTVSANSEDSWKRFCLSRTRLRCLVTLASKAIVSHHSWHVHQTSHRATWPLMPAEINPYITPCGWIHFMFILSLNDAAIPPTPPPAHWLKWHAAGGLLPQ